MTVLAVGLTKSPCDWEQDLVWRISRARPEHTVRGLNFQGPLEAVRRLGGEEALRRCLELAGETRFVSFFNYPVQSLLKVFSFAVEVMGPTAGGGESVLWEMGRQSTLDFLASPVGRAAKVVANGDPRRMLTVAPEIYRQTLGFGGLEVEWMGQRSGRLVRQGDFLPAACHEGSTLELLRQMGGRNAWVQHEWLDGLNGGLMFGWE
ncbi:TIGR02265 family protein [Vitiosangium sp. GDMCC 1.1324]|uniref:TIGR02265 family protein n=1 Tax=Vitiosangium sp. (strain GDMCC 1.1324) TaxID=2138576 RepID=UPI000D3610AE|nr:TIGR02265 family protein [Vitiosangium sp. GDMCC 1.1324]PTL79496.1 TIGR02265 family protein [Vitiosangium sp. GDMCC 1.1324]